MTIEVSSDPLCDRDLPSLLSRKRVAFVGKLGGLNLREAYALVREHGGTPVDKSDPRGELIVIGADAWPLDDELEEHVRAAASREHVEVVLETELWQRLGMVEAEGSIPQLYTPAMLADLLHVPLATIRRWHRRGLIVPVREVHRLPYFDFQEVATARRLARLLAEGASPTAIERKLVKLLRWVPAVERHLAQLSVIIEGREVLLRQGEGLIDSSGQRRFDFDPPPHGVGDTDPDESAVVSLQEGSREGSTAADSRFWAIDEALREAGEFEDACRFQEAVETYRAALVYHGPNSDVNFRLAELLYRLGDVSAARERYFMTLELDEDFVEARANLGCVLAETGQRELAVAAFQGALERHPDYPDVHYHLARTWEELGDQPQALTHWRQFLALAPDSPWSDEARDRLGLP